LGWCHGRKILLGIASTVTKDDLLGQLNRFGLEHYFPEKFILGGEVNKEDKLKELVVLFGVSPDTIFYVGDLPSDVLAAKAVGVSSVGIWRREQAKQRLLDQPPDYLFTSLRELKFIVN